jgi:hypothetical protein
VQEETLGVVDVLLVEDDPGDVYLIREAFAHNKVHNALHVVSDGVAALDFLHRRAYPRRRGRTWSCSTSTSRSRTAARSCHR